MGIEVEGTDVLADAVDGLVALQGGCPDVQNLLQSGSVLPRDGLLLILHTHIAAVLANCLMYYSCHLL